MTLLEVTPEEVLLASLTYFNCKNKRRKIEEKNHKLEETTRKHNNFHHLKLTNYEIYTFI